NIAQRMKKTRDATLKKKNDAGETLNQCLGIAMVGGCTRNNEVNYLLVKLLRAPGGTHTDHQARLLHGPTGSRLGATIGRGAMTNGWVDIRNADTILVMGGNPAENHPCGFKWAIEAKKTRNAKIVCVDPRFNRTAAVADLYAPLRSGTDIAFLAGVINY